MSIRVWSPDDGALLTTLEGDTGNYGALAVGPDRVFSGSLDDIITVWSGETGARLYSFQTRSDDHDYASLLRLACIAPNGTLYSSHASGYIDVWSKLRYSKLLTTTTTTLSPVTQSRSSSAEQRGDPGLDQHVHAIRFLRPRTTALH